jgi:hypothetical protein
MNEKLCLGAMIFFKLVRFLLFYEPDERYTLSTTKLTPSVDRAVEYATFSGDESVLVSLQKESCLFVMGLLINSIVCECIDYFPTDLMACPKQE